MENHLLPRSVSNGRCEKVHFAPLWNTDANRTQTMRGMMIMMGLVGMVMVMVLVVVVLIITIATFRHSTSSQDNFLTMIFATKLISLDEI